MVGKLTKDAREASEAIEEIIDGADWTSGELSAWTPATGFGS